MKDISRGQITAELLELGEMLFDAAIDAAAQRPAGEQTGDTTFLEEMRDAADEFFMALRLLLETGQETRDRGRITSVIFRSV